MIDLFFTQRVGIARYGVDCFPVGGELLSFSKLSGGHAGGDGVAESLSSGLHHPRQLFAGKG